MRKEIIDVVVAGHICFDITPAFKKMGQSRIEEIFVPGKLINVGAASVSTGGLVSNTGLALRRLGIKAELMGKVGDDFYGQATIARLKSLGADKGMVVVKGEESSYTIIIAPPGIDRIFLHNPGANDAFGVADIDFELVRRAKLFHLGYPPLMKKLYTNRGKELLRIFKKAKATGVTTSLDFSLPDYDSPSGRVDWNAILKSLLPYVDLCLPSAEETMFMLNKRKFLAKKKKADTRDMIDDFEPAEISWMSNKLLNYGAGIVIIKCGHRGVYLKTAGKGRLSKIGFAKPGDLINWSNRELWKPSFPVKKFGSAAGAGDSCVAGFLAAYVKGKSVEQTLQYATAVGAQTVMRLDTTSGIKDWKETTRIINSARTKNHLVLDDPRWEFDAAGHLWIGPGNSCHEL